MVKQSKPKKATTKKSRKNHKLSPIEKELLGHCKNQQPVLLYGDDKIGRKDLILNVHKANGGLDQSSEHGDPAEFVSGYSTERTWDHVNLALFDCSGIYHYLTTTEASDPSEYSPHDFDEKKTPYDEGFLYCCKGLLFLDNLLYSDENKRLSHKLDTHIKDQNTSFQWLVIYAEKLDGLSQCFIEQFELVSLEDGNAVTVSVDEVVPDIIHCDDNHGVDKAVIVVEKKCLKRNDINKEVSLLPIQIKLLKFLHYQKNSCVTREDIRNHLWKDRDANDDQITDHVSKLRNAFVEMGFEGKVVKNKIIVTVNKSSRNSNNGGYIFSNNLVLLDYD